MQAFIQFMVSLRPRRIGNLTRMGTITSQPSLTMSRNARSRDFPKEGLKEPRTCVKRKGTLFKCLVALALEH